MLADEHQSMPQFYRRICEIMKTPNQEKPQINDAKRIVSIGLPIFNGEPFIEETLDSLLCQSFQNFELIISDNASTDRTAEICRTYANSDARIRFYRNKRNLGAAQNYNLVFSLSKGKYFKWQASDDKCHRDFLLRCVEVLEDRPDVVLAYTRTFVIDLENNIIHMEDIPLKFDSCDIVERFSCALNAIPYTDVSIFGLIRRDVLAKTNLIGRYLASDRCLIAELALHGPFIRLEEPLFYRRKHAGNIGTSRESLSFYDPNLKGQIVFPAWRVLKEQFAGIARSPIKARLKLALVARLLSWTYERRKTFAWQVKNGVRQFLGRS
jgi:glycosyltransferase involved in cell wall biosynthesis